MGLRIIDRKPKEVVVSNEAKRLELLDLQAQIWSIAHGQTPEEGAARFSEKVRDLRAHLTTHTNAMDIAARFGDQVRAAGADATKAQGSIDQETLLKLLQGSATND